MIWRYLILKCALRYEPETWGMVFPLGMYAAADNISMGHGDALGSENASAGNQREKAWCTPMIGKVLADLARISPEPDKREQPQDGVSDPVDASQQVRNYCYRQQSADDGDDACGHNERKITREQGLCRTKRGKTHLPLNCPRGRTSLPYKALESHA